MHRWQTNVVLVVASLLLLIGCGTPAPAGSHKNESFGNECLESGGAWTYSEGNEWDSCTIYP